MSRNRLSHVLALVAASALAAPLAAAPEQSPAGRPSPRDPAIEVACGPQAVVEPPVAAMRVIMGEVHGRTIFGPGDVVIVNAGSVHGLQAGQEFFVRRASRDHFLETPADAAPVVSIRTAGWLRLEQVGEASATARILQACDGIGDGDYLEPFTLPIVPTPLAGGEPDFTDPARVLMGDERRQVGAAGSFMVLDRGSDHQLQPGQRLTVFRPTLEGGPVRRVAEATLVSVRPQTSLLRIDTSRDAVYVGDRVAIHR